MAMTSFMAVFIFTSAPLSLLAGREQDEPAIFESLLFYFALDIHRPCNSSGGKRKKKLKLFCFDVCR